MSQYSTPPPPPPLPPSYRSNSALPPAGKRGIIVFSVIVAVLVVVGAGVAWRVIESRRLPPRVDEDTETKHKETAQAFDVGSAPASDAEETARIKACIDLFTAALVEKNVTKLNQSFDADRLLEELERMHAFDGIPARSKAQFNTGVKSGITSALTQSQAVVVIRRSVKRVKFSVDRRQAVVYTSDFTDDGVHQKTRWWLWRSGSTWRIFDLESLDGGLRVSSIMATAAQMSLGNPAQMQSVQRLMGAMRLVQAENLPKAQTELEAVRSASFPPDIEAFRHLIWAGIHSRQLKYDLLLKDCDAIEATGHDVPMVHQFRANAYNQRKDYGNALTSALAWKAALGGDADNYFAIGQAQAGLGHHDEAIKAFQQSLDDDSNAFNAMTELAKVLPADRKQEIALRFSRCTKPKEVFAEVAPALQKARELVAMESLIAAYRATGANDPWIDYYTGELKIIRKQYSEAQTTLKPLLATTAALSKSEAERIAGEYLYATERAGEPLVGYENAPDKKKAFELLVGWMQQDNTAPAMIRKLIEAHRPGHADDAQLHFADGKLLAASGDYPAADSAFASALEKAGTDLQRPILSARVEARYKAGKGFSAYADLTPKDTVFVLLAKLYQEARQPDELEKLVTTRRADAPTDRFVPLYDAEVKYLRADYAGVVEILGKNKASLLAEESARFRFRNLYVRSLITVKRYDEALAEATNPKADPPGVVDQKSHHFYAALVHAAAGHVKEATAALDAAEAEGYEETDFYGDWIAGPALRSGAFSEWRKTHPDPNAKPATKPA